MCLKDKRSFDSEAERGRLTTAIDAGGRKGLPSLCVRERTSLLLFRGVCLLFPEL
jgi:hypothetical protein